MRGRVYEMGIIRTRSRIISAYFQHLAGEVRYDATPDAEMRIIIPSYSLLRSVAG